MLVRDEPVCAGRRVAIAATEAVRGRHARAERLAA